MATLFQRVSEVFGQDRWRRAGGPSAFVVVWCVLASGFVGVFAWVATSIAGGTFEAISALKARPVRADTDEADGPGVFHGKLRGLERVAPAGEPGVAWVGWVDKAAKKNGRTLVCVVSQLDGISLERGDRPLVLAVPAESIDPFQSEGFSAPHGISVVAAETTGAVPDRLRSDPACKAPGDSSLQYHQIAWKDGQEIVVSGCREGDRLAPCGDRADFFFSQCAASDGGCRVDAQAAVRTFRARWVSGVAMVVSTGGLIAGGALVVFGVVQLRRHRALQRRRRSVLNSVAREV